jgi:hypothetical protein
VGCCMPGGPGDLGGICIWFGDWLGRGMGGAVPFFRAARASAVASWGRPPVNEFNSVVLNPVRTGKSPCVYLWYILIMLPMKNSFSFGVPASQ